MNRRWPDRAGKALCLAATALWLAGCIYRIDVQQGNLLEESAVDQVEVGMTRSQVNFLLGTPMVADTFHDDRWDYVYYLRHGRSKEIDKRWLVVYFDGDRVIRIDKNKTLSPAS
jgi:outer membrane protein assembly factor BamE